MAHKLTHGAMAIKALAAELDLPLPTILHTIGSHPSTFMRIDKHTVGLASSAEEFF